MRKTDQSVGELSSKALDFGVTVRSGTPTARYRPSPKLLDLFHDLHMRNLALSLVLSLTHLYLVHFKIHFAIHMIHLRMRYASGICMQVCVSVFILKPDKSLCTVLLLEFWKEINR